MLTLELLFPNVGRSNPTHLRRLTLQERARLLACPFFLTADDLLKLRTDPKPLDEPDEVQRVCTGH